MQSAYFAGAIAAGKDSAADVAGQADADWPVAVRAWHGLLESEGVVG